MSGGLQNFIEHTTQLISSSPHNQQDLQILGKLKEDAAKGRSAATEAKQIRGNREKRQTATRAKAVPDLEDFEKSAEASDV